MQGSWRTQYTLLTGMQYSIYIAPIEGIYSEVLLALAYRMLNVIKNHVYVTLASKLCIVGVWKESPEVGPRIHVE